MKQELAPARAFQLEGLIRVLLAAGYAGIVLVCFTTDVGPRIFWTMALPFLILCIVLMGFHTWRRICPLALWGTFGVRLKPKQAKNRKVPEWMERWFFVLSLLFLVIMLVVRLVAINGDGAALGFTLIGMALFAALTNFVFSGRTWCNFICPVGTVERIYTDPNSLRTTGNSQCAKCTACKRHCPDIDHENAYWKDLSLPSRRIAFYSFPGAVLAFYTYYYLRAADWEAYFDGRWTRTPATLELALGPGFFFAPGVPAVAAALLTFTAFMAVSFLLFSLVERLIAVRQKDEERRRHLSLALASFAAFNIFFLFAGAPTFRLIPGATRLVAFIVPVVSAMLLYRRWGRSSDDYVKVKSAKHLLPLWNFKSPPPKDPAEIFAFFKGQQEAHAAQVKAYEEVVRDVLASSVVTQKDLNRLSQMRSNLSINESEHKAIFAELSDEQLGRLDPAHAPTVERRLQLQGYKSALMTLLTRQPSPAELAVLRMDYAIEPAVHEAVLKEIRGEPGLLTERLQHRLEKLTRLRLDIAALHALRSDSQRVAFVMDILMQAEELSLRLTLESLRPLAGADFDHTVAGIFSENAGARRAARESLRPVLRPDLATLLFSILDQRVPSRLTGEENLFRQALVDLSASPDFHQRAGAAFLLGEKLAAPVEPLLRKCLADESELVRETALFTATAALENIDIGIIRTLTDDPDENVKSAARTILARRTTVTDSMVKRAALSPFERLSTFEKMMYLHRIPLFADLDVESLYEISGLTGELVLAAQEVLFREGDTAENVYLIIEGQAEVFKDREGREQVLSVLEPGAILGEMSVIDGYPRAATVRALTPELHLLKIGAADFKSLAAARPELSAQVMRVISMRLREAEQRT